LLISLAALAARLDSLPIDIDPPAARRLQVPVQRFLAVLRMKKEPPRRQGRQEERVEPQMKKDKRG
jgi:hypothetical protein